MNVSTGSVKTNIVPSPRSSKLIKAVLALIIFAIIAIAAGLIYRHFANKSHPNVQATPAQEEALSKSVNASLLNAGKLSEYQNNELNQASEYFDIKNYDDAERVMTDLFNNVPAKKVNTSTYELAAAIAKAKANNEKYKYYLGILISKYSTAGNSQAADYYKAQLANASK